MLAGVKAIAVAQLVPENARSLFLRRDRSAHMILIRLWFLDAPRKSLDQPVILLHSGREIGHGILSVDADRPGCVGHPGGLKVGGGFQGESGGIGRPRQDDVRS